MQSRRVFVLAPFNPDGQRVREAVRRAVEEAGFSVVQDSDAVRPGAERTFSILGSIREADLIIADVSFHNPNVLYEIGFAHALRKPTIFLYNIKSGSGLPSDLVGFGCLTYDPANLRGLSDLVKSETEALAMQRSA